MPITLRYIRPDAAAKLHQLEVEAEVLERVAKALASPHRRRWQIPRFIRRLVPPAWLYLRSTYGIVRSAIVAMNHAVRNPHLAASFRILHGLLSEGAKYLFLTLAALLALALVIALRAPPV